ncbi:MAG: hypothetical protein Q8P67_14000 [archaeon]|nr:hypothetical protein [archaeon]
MADPGRFQPFENEAENQEFRELTLSQTNPEPPFLPHFEKAYPSEYPAEPTFPTHSAQQGPFPNQPPSPTPLHSTPNHGYGNDANNGHVEMADVASDTRPDHHLYLERQINVERFDVLFCRSTENTLLYIGHVLINIFSFSLFLFPPFYIHFNSL